MLVEPIKVFKNKGFDVVINLMPKNNPILILIMERVM